MYSHLFNLMFMTVNVV